MAITANQPADKQSQVTAVGRPLQRIPWSEKIAKEREWFQINAEYYLSLSNFNFDGSGPTRKDIRLLYQVYNSQFPAKWFSHVTDPLSAKNPNHKKFPAKVRPVTILRTNLDLLMGEYPKRPFVYQVTNMSEDGYISYVETLTQALHQNVQQHFAAGVVEQLQAQGVPAQKIPGLDEVELPTALKERVTAGYKDNVAIRGQRWLKRAMKEFHIREEFQRMFKDWLIAGRCVSYKGIRHGNLKYERISPLNIDYDKSPDIEYIEDGEWAVSRRILTLSDIVDEFYDELSDENLHDLENRTQYKSPIAFYQYLQETYDRDTTTGKIPVYHVVWKGKKKLLLVSYPDPTTGQMETKTMDEDYIVNKEAGETSEHIWVNEIYETYRIGDVIYCQKRPIPCQRNEMDNLSRCKLPYNGRCYSDLHSENISVLELGIPFQVMYIIVNYVLEKTIAKNKGKIMMIDKNAIPRGDGWDDEKYFYYADALGYMLVDRSRPNVDKTWNQYHVLDMSLFDQITQLIQLKNNFKQEWDDLIGINRQRKGETMASDLKGVNEMGLMQSSVITDMIFYYFERFTERELQGLLDLSKYTNADGIKSIYNAEDFDLALLDIDPNTYAYAELGVVVSDSSEELQMLNQMKSQQNIPAMIQAGIKPSTIIEIYQSKNMAELTMKLRQIEDMEAQMEQQQQQTQADMEKAADERKKEYAEFEMNLKEAFMNKEYDRKENIERIKGEFNELSFKGTMDADNNGIPDALELEKLDLERQKMIQEGAQHADKILTENKHKALDVQMAKEDNATKLAIASKKAAVDKIKARRKPTK